MRSCNPVLCSWRQACIWVALFLLPLALESMANEVNHKVFKTPADASVSFQMLQGKSTHIICSGVRISNFELITSISCLKKLEKHQSSNSEIHALSSLGEDYGGIRFVSRKKSEEGAVNADIEKLTTVLLKYPARPNNYWPDINREDFIQNISEMVQGYSPYSSDEQVKPLRSNVCILVNVKMSTVYYKTQLFPLNTRLV